MEIIEKIKNYDKIIHSRIKNGFSIKYNIDSFDIISNNISNRPNFMRVNMKYLYNNWNLIDKDKKNLTLYGLFLSKRVDEMKWLLSKNFNLPEEDQYLLLCFRDKFKKKKNTEERIQCFS
jgi:hypothetical protein